MTKAHSLMASVSCLFSPHAFSLCSDARTSDTAVSEVVLLNSFYFFQL